MAGDEVSALVRDGKMVGAWDAVRGLGAVRTWVAETEAEYSDGIGSEGQSVVSQLAVGLGVDMKGQ